MLQTVHKRIATPKASSLYCVWVCQGPEPRLEAIWIDSEMSAFKKQFVCEAEIAIQAGSSLRVAKEEPEKSQVAE